jgi:D-methionine transport system permease protein
MSYETLLLITSALFETMAMVFISGAVSAVIGIPLGIVLYVTKPRAMLESKLFNQVLGGVVNIGRSVPFIILMVALIPFTRLLIGTTIGTSAASVPLSIAAIPFVARLVEGALMEVPKGLIEAGLSMGATSKQIVFKILLPESRPRILQGMTITWVNLVGYSAMAGAIGGGGLGDLAIRYGYHRFDTTIMLITVLVLIALVQLIQLTGDRVTRRYDHMNPLG